MAGHMPAQFAVIYWEVIQEKLEDRKHHDIPSTSLGARCQLNEMIKQRQPAESVVQTWENSEVVARHWSHESFIAHVRRGL